MVRAIQYFKKEFAKMPKWIFAVLVAFCTCQFLGLIFEIQRAAWLGETTFPWLFLALVLGGASAWLLIRILPRTWLGGVFKAPFSSPKERKAFPFWGLWLACIILWLPYFLAFYPGILCYDFTSQLAQYFRIAAYSTHHPLAHTLLMSWIIDVGMKLFGTSNAGSALYVFIQMVMVAASLAYALYKIQNLRIPGWLFWGIAGLLYLMPVFPLLAVSATKDVIFACFLLVALIKAVPLTTGTASVWDWLGFVLFGIAAGLMRNNAVYAYVAIVALLAIQIPFSPRKKQLAKIVVSLLLMAAVTLGANYGLEKATGAVKGSKAEMLSIPSQQMIRVYAYHKEELPQKTLDDFHYFFYDQAREEYHPWIADSAKGNLNMEALEYDARKFVKMWLSLGLEYWQDYIGAFLVQNEPIWYMGTDPVLGAKDSYLEMFFYYDALPDVHPDSKIPWLKSLMEILFSFRGSSILRLPVIRLFVHPATYTWLLILILAVLLEKRKYQFILLPLIPLMYSATLLLGPCILPRYCLAAMMATPVILAYVIHSLQQEDDLVSAD